MVLNRRLNLHFGRAKQQSCRSCRATPRTNPETRQLKPSLKPYPPCFSHQNKQNKALNPQNLSPPNPRNLAKLRRTGTTLLHHLLEMASDREACKLGAWRQGFRFLYLEVHG